MSIELVGIITVAVAVWLYVEINKITKKIDSNAQNPDVSRYTLFCSQINSEISSLKNSVQNGDIVCDDEKKELLLSGLSELSRELVFIESMHSTNKNERTWSEKLGSFMIKFDALVEKNLGEEHSMMLRQRLKEKF